MQQKKLTLLTRFTALFLVFAVLLCVLICSVSYFSYRASTLSHYANYALCVGNTVAAQLDVDEVLAFAESRKTDDEYYRIHQDLLDLRQSMEVEYIYVQIPVSNEKVMYIFDALDLTSGEEPLPLGILDDYNDNFQTAKKAMATGQPTAGLEITQSQYGYLASAYVPLKDATGTPVAYVGVDIRMDAIVAFLQRYLIIIIAFTTLLVAICFAVLLMLVKKSVIAPVSLISEKADAFTENIGDAHFELIQISTRDEIGSLAQSVNRMFMDLRSYTRRLAEETASNQRIEDDLKMARSIQEGLLPRIFPPFLEYTDVEIVADMTPAQQVSGNFYDCFPVDKNHMAFVVADVTGGGVAAALFMMVVHTLIKNQAVSGYSPREILEAVNRQLCERNEQRMTASVFIGIYDSRSNILQYSNAGLAAPIIRRAAGGATWLPVEQQQPLAQNPAAEYVTQVETLDPGDCLLLYTDGLTAAKSAGGQLFGADTLMQLMKKVNIEALVPQEIVELLVFAVSDFTEGSAQDSDMTIMLMRRL